MATKYAKQIPDPPQGDPDATARTNLRLLCALRALTMSEASTRAGLGRNALSQFCSGRSNLSYRNMLALCAVLDFPIGLINQPDAVTCGKIRLHKALARLSDDELALALEAIEAGRAQRPAPDTPPER